MAPLKWQSYILRDWYFEQQHTNSNYWLEYDVGVIGRNLSQISTYTDADGDLVVILKEIGHKNRLLRFMEGMFCVLTENQTCRIDRIAPGFWIKNKGIFFLSNRFVHYI